MSWRRIAAVTGGNTTAQAVNFLSIFNLIVAYVRTVPAMYKTHRKLMGFQLPTSTGKRRISEPSTVSLQHIYQPIIQATF